MATIESNKGIFMKNILNKNITLSINDIGSNIKDILEKKINDEYRGGCIEEGYIKQNTCKIHTYSCGKVLHDNIVFNIVFECLICYPIEGMVIDCIVENITKAGIKATTSYDPSPLVIFLAKDHNYSIKKFNHLKENENIKVKVIGQRYELNDEFISVIGELVETVEKPKPKLKLKIKNKK